MNNKKDDEKNEKVKPTTSNSQQTQALNSFKNLSIEEKIKAIKNLFVILKEREEEAKKTNDYKSAYEAAKGIANLSAIIIADQSLEIKEMDSTLNTIMVSSYLKKGLNCS